MEKICRNCMYFMLTETNVEGEPKCGNCQKPGTAVAIVDGNLRGGVFTWDNDTCAAFKAKQKIGIGSFQRKKKG